MAQAAYDAANSAGESISVSLINSSNNVSNSVSNINAIRFDSDSGFDVTNLGSGAVKIQMNSTFKTWQVDGQANLIATGLDTVEFVAGNNITITTDANSIPKSITFNATDNSFLAYAQANNAFNQANTANSSAQAAFDKANSAFTTALADSLRLSFTNDSATNYKMVALNENAETVLASALNSSHVDRVVGILDANNSTVTFGTVTNLSWTWTPEESLYLGSNGEVVTTSTVDGAIFSLRIGYAISSTKIFVKLGIPVVL